MNHLYGKKCTFFKVISCRIGDKRAIKRTPNSNILTNNNNNNNPVQGDNSTTPKMQTVLLDEGIEIEVEAE